MAVTLPATIQEFKTHFDRGFDYAPTTDPDNKAYIRDVDITNAMNEAIIVFNASVWEDDDIKKLAFLYLTAHYLCLDLQMADAGIKSTGSFMIASKSVGSVSASYTVPQSYMNDPVLYGFSQTQYGAKYISLIYPRAIGKVDLIRGATTIE